jgi:Arc/MetJ-type ribon-helix-helix transcriptional regulator
MSKKSAKKQGDGFKSIRLPEGFLELIGEFVTQGIFASKSQGVVALATAGMMDINRVREMLKKKTIPDSK